MNIDLNIPNTIGVYCPLEINGKKFQLRKGSACFSCLHFRGVKELTKLDVPIENKYHIVCQAPMTRSFRNVALED